MRCVTNVLALMVMTNHLVAQVPSPRPVEELRFEVASVRPVQDLQQRFTFSVRPDGLVLEGLPLLQIIGLAYDVNIGAQSRTFVGAEELLASRFTVNAKASRTANPAEIRAMLRTLLAERFNLRLRPETRQMPIFALTRSHKDRLGRNLQPIAAADCNPFWRISVETFAELSQGGVTTRCARTLKMDPDGAMNKEEIGPIAVLIGSLEDVVISRPIVDATGLDGWFRWNLRYQMEVPEDPDAPQAPFILDALPEQLGLTLERRTGPVELFVIDNLQRPTPD